MTFIKTRSLMVFFYRLGESNILRVSDNVMNLGFKLNSRLDPGRHIENIQRKFFRFASRLVRITCEPHNCLNIGVLWVGITFLNGLFSNKVEPSILVDTSAFYQDNNSF